MTWLQISSNLWEIQKLRKLFSENFANLVERGRELTMERAFRVPNSIAKQQVDKMSSASNMWYIHELERMTQRTETRVQKAEIKMSMIPRL